MTAAAVAATALLAATAAADTSLAGDAGGGTDPPPVDGTLEQPQPEGETIEDLPSDDDFVEQLPPADLLKKLPPEPTRSARTIGVGTDGHYCGSFYVKHVSYTFDYDDPDNANGYTRIHVQPTRRYQYFLSGGWPWDGRAWSALANCISSGGPHGVYVRSWAAIEDQFRCHALHRVTAIIAGRSWDLEGHRHATNNRLTWIRENCNW